ncbi:MAG: HemK2/MTQ2 family protein methyltransferase [Nitrososphaeria archaeon]
MYLPAEDTYLLIRGLESYDNLGKVLEIGFGSGKVAEALNRRSEIYVGCDIDFNVLKDFKIKNPYNPKIELVCCDSASCFRNSFFDTIVFNPPYLPSDSIIDHTINGGPEGCELILKFLETSFRILNSTGSIFFIASTLSNLSKITSFIKDNGFGCKEVIKEKLFFEHIILFKCKKLS